MLHSLSKNIADFLLRQKCFDKTLLPVYIYGVELFLSSLLGVTLVLCCSLLLRSFMCGVLFLLAFIFLRLFTGGLHCNTYLACNTVMVATFIGTVALYRIISSCGQSGIICSVMMTLTLIITLVFAPVINPNKDVPTYHQRRCKLIAISMLIAHFIIYVVLNRYISTEIIIITDFISVVYIIIGLIKNKIERRMSDENQKEHR